MRRAQKLQSLALVAGLHGLLPQIAAPQAGPFWAVQESFAISREPAESGRYPILTFVPRTFLLFDIDEEEPDNRLGNADYSAVTTQDGVRVWLLHSTISKKTVREGLGSHHIIFNAAFDVCRVMQCDPTDDREILPIAAGEVFTAADEPGRMVRLEGVRHGERITGYLTTRQLEGLNQEGVITRADRDHPRLRVRADLALYTGTSCDSTAPARDVVAAVEFTEADSIAFSVFELGTAIRENGQYRITFRTRFGAQGEEVEFRVYHVADRWEGTQARYVAQVRYTCEREGAVVRRKSIRSAYLKADTTGWQDVMLEPMGTPDDLLRLSGDAYLFSVNSAEQYRDLMAKLGEEFGNRALAGYFLAEFNRSCSSVYRKGPECGSHRYR